MNTKKTISDFFEVFKLEMNYSYQSPLFEDSVQAGFPSPATDYIEKTLDLNQLLIKHPAATFFVRAKGDSMIDVGIFDNDILIVDRALSPKNNSIIIAVLDNEFTVKQITKQDDKYFLLPANPKFKKIELNKDMDFMVWGVVTNVIHKLF